MWRFIVSPAFFRLIRSALNSLPNFSVKNKGLLRWYDVNASSTNMLQFTFKKNLFWKHFQLLFGILNFKTLAAFAMQKFFSDETLKDTKNLAETL